MSAPLDGHGSATGNGDGPFAPPGSTGETLPVLADEARALPRRPAAAPAAQGSGGVVVPIVQAAAAAAGGFVAGAALAGLVRRHQRRVAATRPRRATRAPRRSSGGRSAGRSVELVPIVGSRSLLVDVHLLGER
jgi:hypothetical protein